MSNEPEQIRAEIDELLAQLPDTAEGAADLADVDLDAVAAGLDEAHDVLVRALEAVEKGPTPGLER
jgi:Tfp pilus assembly protein PilO